MRLGEPRGQWLGGGGVMVVVGGRAESWVAGGMGGRGLRVGGQVPAALKAVGPLGGPCQAI